MVRVLLIDPHALSHAAWQALLEPVRDLQLLSESSQRRDWPRLCQELQADVLLINVHQPGIQVEKLLAEMAVGAPQTHVLLLLAAEQFSSFDLHKLLQTGG